jgi:hypothetical protein
MGQYFVIANLDKRETFAGRGWKLWEICANNDIRVLGYLLATNSWDGTNIARIFMNKQQLDSIIKSIKDFLGDDYEYDVVTTGYRDGEPHGYVVPKLKYFGRWCGDRIAIIGDYADDGIATNAQGLPTYDEVIKEFTDITEGVYAEFNWFIQFPTIMVSDPVEIKLQAEFEKIIEELSKKSKKKAEEYRKKVDEIKDKEKDAWRYYWNTIRYLDMKLIELKTKKKELLRDLIKTAKDELVKLDLGVTH